MDYQFSTPAKWNFGQFWVVYIVIQIYTSHSSSPRTLGKANPVTKICSCRISNILQREGFEIEWQKLQVNVMCFINDLPARTFLKYTKGHTGFYSCERCTARGISFKHRIIFPELHCSKQSDQSFSNHEQNHAGLTPLHKHENVDLVFDFSYQEHASPFFWNNKEVVNFLLDGFRFFNKLRKRKLTEVVTNKGQFVKTNSNGIPAYH